jgi:hypothetical protein
VLGESAQPVAGWTFLGVLHGLWSSSKPKAVPGPIGELKRDFPECAGLEWPSRRPEAASRSQAVQAERVKRFAVAAPERIIIDGEDDLVREVADLLPGLCRLPAGVSAEGEVVFIPTSVFRDAAYAARGDATTGFPWMLVGVRNWMSLRLGYLSEYV